MKQLLAKCDAEREEKQEHFYLIYASKLKIFMLYQYVQG